MKFMKNPLNDDAIESMGIKGLGDTPAETLAAYVYYIETLVTSQMDLIDNTLPIHDRLLEATLVIFDALYHDKIALNRLYPDIIISPNLLKDFIPILCGFFTRMFVQIELAPDTIENKARFHTYTIYFNYWFCIWLKDETPDQSNTMAAIDQDLTKLRAWKEWFTNIISTKRR